MKIGTNTVVVAVATAVDGVADIAGVASVQLAHNSSVATAVQNILQRSFVVVVLDVGEDAQLVVAYTFVVVVASVAAGRRTDSCSFRLGLNSADRVPVGLRYQPVVR